MPGKPEKKIIIAIIVIILVGLISAWLVVFVLGNKVRQSFENYQKEKLNFIVLEEKRNKILNLVREMPNLKEEKKSLDSMLIKKDAALPFLRSLEKIAGDASCQIIIEPVDISKIKFEKNIPSSTKKQDEDDQNPDKKSDQTKISEEKNKKEDELTSLKEYPAFSVEILGRFSSVVDFFEKFESMPYFVRPLIIDISKLEKKTVVMPPTGLDVLPEEENTKESDVQMTMTFIVYGN